MTPDGARRAPAAFALLAVLAFIPSLISPAYAVAGLLLVAWITALRREERSPESLRSPFVFLFGVLALLTALSAAFSTDPSISVRHLAGLSLLLIVPITMDLVDGEGRARTICLALALSGVIEGAAGIWQFLHGGDDLDNRIRGSLSHYMTFAGLEAVSGCLLLGIALEERGRRRWLGALAVIPLAAVLLTYTRGAYVGIVAALLLYVAVRRPKGLLLLAPAVIAVFLLAPPEIRQRIRSIADLSDTTNRDRFAMARAGARMVRDRPVFGLGPDMVQPFYPLYRDPDAPRWTVPHLHDNVIQIAAAHGIFAAAAYLAIVAVFFVRTVRKLRGESAPGRAAVWAGALLAGAALTVFGLFEYNFGDTEVEIATLLVFALPFSAAARAGAT
ncbi:MAG TPA: O-antigen ligase family protein [Thermoanaerobaculia bacterium]|nr:O-antigen ligase family protein [Thermoanaerobaculia bacterium]